MLTYQIYAYISNICVHIRYIRTYQIYTYISDICVHIRYTRTYQIYAYISDIYVHSRSVMWIWTGAWISSLEAVLGPLRYDRDVQTEVPFVPRNPICSSKRYFWRKFTVCCLYEWHTALLSWYTLKFHYYHFPLWCYIFFYYKFPMVILLMFQLAVSFLERF